MIFEQKLIRADVEAPFRQFFVTDSKPSPFSFCKVTTLGIVWSDSTTREEEPTPKKSIKTARLGIFFTLSNKLAVTIDI